jgi:hypothetical protein
MERDFSDAELDEVGELALGTLLLEETDLAVTDRQAENMLPVWEAALTGIRDAGTASEADDEATLTAIKATLTAEQLEAISAFELGIDDAISWMNDRPGADIGAPPFAGGRGLDAMSDEERADMRATAEAGGFRGPADDQGARRERSPEELQSLRETAAAGGAPESLPPSGPSRGVNAMLIRGVITLLENRATSD